MATKRVVCDGRTPALCFCDIGAVIMGFKLKDNCKCSAFILPEAHKSLSPKLTLLPIIFIKI